MAKQGRFYPNLTGQASPHTEQAIYRLFDNVYQLRTAQAKLENRSRQTSEAILEQIRPTEGRPKDIPSEGNAGEILAFRRDAPRGTAWEGAHEIDTLVSGVT